MNDKLPILIIIPHGGIAIPEELSGYEEIDKFDIFMSADTCANSLFAFDDLVTAKIDTHISRLFVDLDRPYTAIHPVTTDGVIKSETPQGRKIFKKGYFPDVIAMANILERYYYSFYNTIEKIINTKEIKLIIECHTMMAVGPKSSIKPGVPRPIITLNNNQSKIKTCNDDIIIDFAEILKKEFVEEKDTITKKITINNPAFNGHIMKKISTKNIPMIRLSISKSLFLNEKYFSFDFLRVDELRINYLKSLIVKSIEKLYKKYF